MMYQRLSGKSSVKNKLIRVSWHVGKVLFLAGVALLCVPFLSRVPQERQPTQTGVADSAPAPAPALESRIGVTLRHGDTLLAVLKRFGLQAPSAHALIEKIRPLINLRKIRPGDNVHLVLSGEDKSLQGMEFVMDADLIRVKATDNGWSAERSEIPSVRETRVIRGTIQSSLYQSGVEAGLSAQNILDLAKIFESDIDFFSDFHSGNTFDVIVDEVRYADGRRGAGRIVAARLEAENDAFDAYYFTGKDGEGAYYNGKGEGTRRSFLRAPLSYARISSPYNAHRLHPIFRNVRPHLAIDYAAPAGTPVVAIGRGRVEFVGWRNGYGNVVDVRHSGNYTSRYAHFSRFAANLHKGQSVEAGEVVGYVGQTGHATGPHLHFEFLRGTTKINFLDLRLPKTEHLVGEELRRFNHFRDQQLALLQGGGERVAGAHQGL